ncbi:hypothetical protein BDR04DRAFT_1092310 [Suillus decipiens]|nr:hypothetical protein BDR04DRAFT_1092310 [Suillus decipiens]
MSKEHSMHQAIHSSVTWHADSKQPFQYSFAMHEGPLTIRDIVRSHLQSPKPALLSTCRNEAIHVAVAMRSSVFRKYVNRTK